MQAVTIIQAPALFFKDIPLIAGIVTYLLISPLLFYFPIWKVHEAMINHRDQLAKEISIEFDEAMDKYTEVFFGSDADEDSLQKLQMKYRAALEDDQMDFEE